jgi:hypothetical protein
MEAWRHRPGHGHTVDQDIDMDMDEEMEACTCIAVKEIFGFILCFQSQNNCLGFVNPILQ